MDKNTENGDGRSLRSLQWDYELDLNKKKEIVDTGDLEITSFSSQNSLCKMISGIKLKGAARPKRRNVIKNPFEIGRCKIWQRQRKVKSWKCKHIMMDSSLVSKTNHQEKKRDKGMAVREILDMADLIGLTYRKDKKQMVEDISKRLDNGII